MSARARPRPASIAVVLCACLAATTAKAAVDVNVVPLYGEYVAGSPLTVAVTPDSGTIDCNVAPAVRRTTATVAVIVQKSSVPAQGTCPARNGVDIGMLDVGTWTITGRVYEADGVTFADGTKTLDVMPLEGRCNRDPTISPSGLIVELKPGQTPESVRARVANDPVFAASLGNPTVNPLSQSPSITFLTFGYPPLEDLTVETARVLQSGAFASAGQNQWVCFEPPPLDLVGRVVEFYNTRLDHYFYTPDDREIAAIEGGAVGADWTRTGAGFYADVAPGCAFLVDSPVYRFAGVPGTGPSSHFFTRDRSECSVVNQSGQWSFEGLPFWAAPVLSDGTCARADLVPLLRIWRPIGESNHRFTTDPAIAESMTARGWILEGPVMCVRKGPQ